MNQYLAFALFLPQRIKSPATTPKITAGPDESSASASLTGLEGSHLVSEEEVRKRTFSGTIWDEPQEREQNWNRFVDNGNENSSNL